MKKQKTKTTNRNDIKRHLKMVTVPHKANHYRPYLIRRGGVVLVVIFICVLQLAQFFPADQAILGDQSLSSVKLLDDMNTIRRQDGLPLLMPSESLSRAASLKAKDMFSKQYWAHTSPDGISPWHWLGEVGYDYSFAGENLAKNFKTAEGVTAAWMASPEHRANVLGAQYTQAGFAAVNGMLNNKPTTIVVALYGTPHSPAVAGVQDAAPTEYAPTGGSLSLISRFGLAFQSLPPGAIGSLVLIFIVIVVAMAAQFYRNKLPKNLQQTWYKHHGIVKAGGMVTMAIIVVFLYSGGQI